MRALLDSNDTGPDLGEQNTIDFWFARPGWTFSATFRQADQTCPRNTTVDAVNTNGQWFQLAPADTAGTYEVDLVGHGPEGNVASRFVWTTTTDGPVDPPVGAIGLFPKSRGEGSFALELRVDDLPFQPTAADLPNVVNVNVTSADGKTRTLTAPLVAPSLDCGYRGARGSFYYQAEWNDDISTIGQAPLLLESELTIRDTTYAGRTTWRADTGATPYAMMKFEPPLPSADAE